MKKIAIIGAGAVGSSAAYYLSKQTDLEMTVFDDGQGQATKAAAGIISPWFSKRRNKAWYKLARLGADFYPELIADLKKDGIQTDFYQQTGVFLLKKKEDKLQELYDLALSRREESPLIGDLAILSEADVQRKFPELTGFSKLLYASGGARVEGAELTKKLLKAAHLSPVKKKVSLEVKEGSYLIDGEVFDSVILATGAWLSELLSPLGFEVDVRPQKGQLRDYFFDDLVTEDYPVVMPEGELDIIPFKSGKISMGATHENDKGFDLTVDEKLLAEFEREAQTYFPKFAQAQKKQARVGVRAYTSDYSPFFGQIAELPNVFVASGLGSTGLTIGPLIGKELAQLVLGSPTRLNPTDYPTEKYIKTSN